ncbi:hypothetical protein CK203_039965 [Vitis vinifera]|uniref:Uncharacterized protein n=1 Tax=Vitis vinifera TaxID=29760 RepID=A0A438I310_VITVI|nr:hypothetical protein CK203_039965 [Vitis vinifera]
MLVQMSEASRGGRSWFAIESKSFELQVEEVGGKLRGCMWERCRGITSWIRFGEVSLSWLLDGVEACCRDNGNRRWVLDWEEGGRKYRLEQYSNEAGSSFSVQFSILSLREIAKPRPRKIGDSVWLELGERELLGRKDQLDKCLGRLRVALMGRGLLLFEFESLSEAEWQGICTKVAWVRVAGLSLQMWSREVFKKIGDGCRGFIAVNEDTAFFSKLQWARILVKLVGKELPSSLEIVVGSGCFAGQLWEEDEERPRVERSQTEGGRRVSEKLRGGKIFRGGTVVVRLLLEQ